VSRPKLLLPLGILAAGLLVVALVIATRPRAQAQATQRIAPLVEVIEARPQPVRFEVQTQGTVMPRSQSELVAQVAGEVIWVSPSLVSGGFFEAAEALVRIDPSDYEAELEGARAAVARARSERSRAARQLERQEQLAQREVVSEALMDDVRTAFRVADAALREASALLRRAERDMERTELRAPYAGRVREENVDVGQFVARGTSVARLYAVDYAEVRLPVPDRELRFIDVPLAYRNESASSAGAEPAPGPAVRLYAEFAGEAREWMGHIVRTEGELDPKSRMVHLVARVEDPYGRLQETRAAPLAVGLFVNAEILGREVLDTIVLPRSALHETEAGPSVLVLEDDGRLRFRAVDVLRLRRDQVILAGDRLTGERVCTSPLRAAVDGMHVRVIGESEPLSAISAGQPGSESESLR
jgi:RND family efflux transporter MFP subunit